MKKSFLQSKGWEKFQRSVGFPPSFRYGETSQTFRVDGVLVIKKNLVFNKSYLYCPRPDFGNRISEFRIFFDKVKELAGKEKAIFLRLDLIDEYPTSDIRHPTSETDDVQPSQTLVLDLAQSEEQLLKNMHQKTRYNIRLAEKRGVKVVQGNSSDFEKFWELMEETTKRDGFRVHSKEYYKKMVALTSQTTPVPSLSKEGNEDSQLVIKLYFAEYEDKVLAAGVFAFYNDTVTYLHGASSDEHRNVMAPYLLHWKLVKLAKKLGYKHYDLYGISEKKWPGLTRFKRGFGGKEINYPGTFDVVYSKRWYFLYKFVRGIRRIF